MPCFSAAEHCSINALSDRPILRSVERIDGQVPSPTPIVGTVGDSTSVTVTVEGKTVKVDNAKVIKTDIEASNGVIHVIDRVLLP